MVLHLLLCDLSFPEDDYSWSPRAPPSKVPKLDEGTAPGGGSGHVEDPLER